MKDISGIVAWLDDGALSASGPQGLMEELCSRLAGAGIPLERASIFVTMLHPDIAGLSSIWRRGQPVELAEAAFDLVRSDAFLAAPGVWVQRMGMALRRRLDDDAVAAEFPFLGKLRGEGFTDYLATPLHFTNGEIHVASWAARQPAGFTDEDVAVLTAVARPLARLVEIRSLRRTEATLLETYIGRQAGARVLAGHIRRGDTESIHAAIWLSDLRGFTRLADRSAPRELTALLNRYFDCQVPAIEARGGEVLKFMGDGLLAIFPTADDGPARVCAAALAAAREARANILALERKAAEGRSAGLPFSLALHVGEVLYGNVGGGRRLDFTVIGPAINLAARLERLAREFGRSIIASAVFADICGERLTPLGSYALRDISAVQPAFGLPEENVPAGRNSHDATIGHPEARPALS
jgi:adenylate cyclase